MSVLPTTRAFEPWILRCGAAFTVGAVLCGCGASPTAPPASEAPAAVAQVQGFVDKVWMSADASAPPGTMRIFMASGVLVMDSCWETYRLERWRTLDDGQVEWQEDTAIIRAEIAQPADDRLQVRLHLVGGVKDETFRLAPTPYLCPDLPR